MSLYRLIVASSAALLLAAATVHAMANPHDGSPPMPMSSPVSAGHVHGTMRAEIGSPAPPFTLAGVLDQELTTISLSDYRGKWVVVLFYPGDFTFVCPTEIKGFNKVVDEFTAANAAVLAISVDSKYSHLAWIKSGAVDKLRYPLLSDFSKRTARAYGVLDENTSSARRGLFIIDPRGMIQYMVVHNDKVGRSVEETMRVLKALQTEELCPLNWKPGEKTIGK